MFETGLFDSDRAKDIRREFEAEMDDGVNPYQAGETVLQTQIKWINDPNEGPVIFYAIAALQMEHGVIDQRVRKRALTYINSGEGLEAWRGAPPEKLAARHHVEQTLRAKLVGMG